MICKGPVSTTLGFASHMDSVATIQVCLCSGEGTIDVYTKGMAVFQQEFIYNSCIWLPDHRLLTSDLEI